MDRNQCLHTCRNTRLHTCRKTWLHTHPGVDSHVNFACRPKNVHSHVHRHFNSRVNSRVSADNFVGMPAHRSVEMSVTCPSTCTSARPCTTRSSNCISAARPPRDPYHLRRSSCVSGFSNPANRASATGAKLNFQSTCTRARGRGTKVTRFRHALRM